ncbi:hypothetical protein KKC1_05450 [Calderihabitans maritimus]|uniref:Uncharacterized protein n=1 Tax=Calderihabitans maritimus TaxID=1246530 RepID=A0A1Z5HPD8_9FIRM|nr:hypothetical protein KKC1_05450 [Calderihabitans maritimus]
MDQLNVLGKNKIIFGEYTEIQDGPLYILFLVREMERILLRSVESKI